MLTEGSTEDGMELEARVTKMYDADAVADQLQEVYEHVLNDKRPEAVGAAEELAKQLNIKVERPDRFQTRRRQ